jgi:hypothetical protein
MTRLLILTLPIAIGGCAAAPIEPSPNPNWARVSGEEAGCVSYGPRRREAVDLNIILKPEFEEALSSQLDETDRKAAKCWYETPSGTIRLFTGDFCGGGANNYFEQQASGWKLVGTSLIVATCHPTKR